MVRRSGVANADGAAQSGAHGDDSRSWPGTGRPAARPAKAPWSGSGGRWMVWPMRIVLWAVILIVGYRGVMAILLNETPASKSGTASPAASGNSAQFPVTLAEAYALQFGQVYLNFNPNNATQRAQQLAAFIPASLAQSQPELGWNGNGTMTLSSEQVAGIEMRSAQSAVVTLLATVNGRMIELGVPVYSSGGGVVVTGEPAWLPAPSKIQPPNTQQQASDQGTQNALSSQLPAFFQAYASGDTTTLNRFLAPGVSLTGLGGAVTFAGITNITAPAGGSTREITVTVNWQLAGQQGLGAAQVSTTYDMTVIDQQSGKWYVEEIRASTQPMGTQ